ncbi:MAG: cyclase family protein [Anaerolineales bacterium]|nr:cyclase family protein [Anaerolineales bacterium]MCB8952597.1 cyclase family protein [Ardenticatenales bacterium]
MTLYDISRTLNPTLAPWPEDTPFGLTPMLRRADGHSVNLTTITTSAHIGTHMDAPHHFADGVRTVESLPLSIYWGTAQVVTVRQMAGPLMPADFTHINLHLAPRILIHSQASHLDPTRFPDAFVYPSPELAAYLGQQGIILFGSDAPSMDDAHSTDMPGHNALLRHGIAILEGLMLADVPDGVYELAALPLKIEGGDGSPVRAALKTIDVTTLPQAD